MNHQFFYKAFKKRTCFKCYGKGEAECRCCGHETECDECDGDGILVNFEYMGHAAGSKDGYIKPSMIDLEANAAINYFYLPILERIMNVFPGAWYLHIDSTDHLKPVWFVSDSVIYMIATMRKW